MIGAYRWSGSAQSGRTGGLPARGRGGPRRTAARSRRPRRRGGAARGGAARWRRRRAASDARDRRLAIARGLVEGLRGGRPARERRLGLAWRVRPPRTTHQRRSGQAPARIREPAATSRPAAASAKKMPHWMPTFAATPWVVIPGLSNSRSTSSSAIQTPAANTTARRRRELERASLATREQQVQHSQGDEQDGGLDEREDLERVQITTLQRRRPRGVHDRVLLIPRQEHRHEQRRRGAARKALLGRQCPPGADQSCHASRLGLPPGGRARLAPLRYLISNEKYGLKAKGPHPQNHTIPVDASQ